MIDKIKQLFHHKTPEEVQEEVYREPTVRRAREGLKRVDLILIELQKLEGKRR